MTKRQPIRWTKKVRKVPYHKRKEMMDDLLEYLNRFSAVPITAETHRTIQAYTFDECEDFLKSFFPNAVKREKGMFIFEYFVDNNYVGFVSMYTGTEFFAEISKHNKYEESELTSHE